MHKLNVGAGDMRLEDFENIDSQPYAGVDVVCRVPPLPYEDGTAQEIYTGHFVEHLAPWDVQPFLDECRRVLIAGGTLTIVVPDADKARLMVESGVIGPEAYALMVGGATYDDMPHWCLWSPQRLALALERGGFVVNTAYDWRTDPRVYDRTAGWQCGAQGVRS